VTSLAWVIYDHPDPLSVMNGRVNDTCVAFVLIDAHTMRSSGETVACTSHPAPDCPANAQQLGRGPGGPPHLYGQLYRKLPTTSGRWTKLPNSPLTTRFQPVVVWAGDQLIVWGGQSGAHGSTLHGDGAAYDPATRRWTTMPSAPISPRVSAAAVWTGSEVVIWGGYNDLSSASSLHVTNTGAAYNPKTRTWRTLANSPLSASSSPGIAWTGSEVIIVDGQPAVMTNTLRGQRQAAAWNPSTNHWRTLPREPAGTPSAFNVTVAHWSDDRLLVFHGYGVTGDPAATTVDSYDPVTNHWTHLHKCDGAGYVSAAYDLDGQVLVPPYADAGAYLYSPQHNTWTPTAAPPLSTYASAPTSGGGLLILTGSAEGHDIKPGDAALWDPRTDSWAKPPRMPVRPGDPMIAVEAGASVLVWTGNGADQLYAFTS
jgi:N-acetylneuraminic acid mutarotase